MHSRSGLGPMTALGTSSTAQTAKSVQRSRDIKWAKACELGASVECEEPDSRGLLYCPLCEGRNRVIGALADPREQRAKASDLRGVGELLESVELERLITVPEVADP